MAAQQTLFAETIRAMKLAMRRREHDSESDEPIHSHTNRGNKLKRKASHVREGRLDTTGGRSYRRRVDHASYQRYIIHDNPPRLDEDGDLIEYEGDEEDEAANLSPAEDNPFEDTKLEYLLAPLTSASELATHPSLSIPYTSKSLLEMAESARELVHREREALWRAKQLLNRFRGDEVWVPLEKMETVQDTLLLDDELINEDYSINDSTMSIEQQAALVDGTQQASLSSTNGAGGNPSIPTAQDGEANGVNTMDMANGDGVGVNATEKVEEQDAPLADAPNGSNEDNNLADVEDQGAEQESKEEPTAMQIDGAEGGAVAQPETEEGDDAMDTGSVRKSVEREASPASTVGHRMTTRAKARESNSPAPLDSHSPSPVPSSIPSINPFFNFPATCLPDRDFGLPAQEAEDTRRVLVLYVQKQEQVVREANALLQGLLKADRMRKDVFRWAKAEGHVGELSDGEDWYDMEEWGLTEPLKKGKDEEEMEDEGRGKRKGRRGGGKI